MVTPSRKREVLSAGAVPAELAQGLIEQAAEIVRLRNQKNTSTDIVLRANRDMAVYAEFVHGVKPARHHQVWIKALHDLVAGAIPNNRLLIIAPPGSGKSSYTSQIFPTWYLGSHPSKAVLFVTASDTQAMKFHSVIATTLTENEKHRMVFPSRAAQPDTEKSWSEKGLRLQGRPQLEKDPSYQAIGYESRIIGARADMLIIDDPLSQKETSSRVSVAAAKEYYSMTLSTRLQPGAREVAIMTRWEEDDMASFLMAMEPKWHVIHMPSIGYWGDDEPLWPEFHSREFLNQRRASLGGPTFEAVYQGDPTSLGGNIFQSRNWFRDLPPMTPKQRADLTIFQYWDPAFSEKETSDFSVCITLGVDRTTGNMYVLSVFRDRLTTDGVVQEGIRQWSIHRPGMIAIEEPAYRQALSRDIRNRMVKSGVTAAVISAKATGDKVMRARLPASRAEAGLLHIDRHAPWAEDFMSECMGFPNMKHDDQVDALSGAVQLALEKTGLASVATEYGLSVANDVDENGMIDLRAATKITIRSGGESRVMSLENVRRDTSRYSIRGGVNSGRGQSRGSRRA